MIRTETPRGFENLCDIGSWPARSYRSVRSLSSHTWLKRVLGWSFRNQSWKVPERGHPGATTWLRTVTRSLVKWNAGKSTTGVRRVLGPESLAIPEAGNTPATARQAAAAPRSRDIRTCPPYTRRACNGARRSRVLLGTEGSRRRRFVVTCVRIRVSSPPDHWQSIGGRFECVRNVA